MTGRKDINIGTGGIDQEYEYYSKTFKQTLCAFWR